MTRGMGVCCALLLALIGAFVPASASAAPKRGTIVATKVPSRTSDVQFVRETFVRVYDPLPASAGAHPAACDWITYLRFRDADGPSNPSKADAVAVLIPGFLGGAGSFDQLARNTVRDGIERGRHVEVWALDRRANCLEDHRGVVAAAKAHDPTVAWNYYWHGAAVNGRRFAGFKTPAQAQFLKDFGLERTVRDWYEVLRTGIPSQKVRARKVICGGHSLGGPLTAAFSSWDFDGNTATKNDAGYNQCAGFLGLDTTLSAGGGGGSSALDLGGIIGLTGVALPFVAVPPLTPETFQVPDVFGVGTFFSPQGRDLIRELPHTTTIDLTTRILFSRDAANFATAIPNIRDFNTTNEVALGGVFDDNSAPLSFLRSSVGFLTGGPLVEKDFPGPDPTLGLPGDVKAPLYSWQTYREVGSRGKPLARNPKTGQPFTSREAEVSDMHQLARTMFDAPSDFIEQYFPTRILTDVVAAGSGDNRGSLSGLRNDGPGKKPAALINAGDSSDNDAAPDTGPPKAGTAPNALARSVKWILPGYNHLDVLTAARRQNDGRPEPSADRLTSFMLSLVPLTPKIRVSVRPRRIRAGKRLRLRFRVRSTSAKCRRGVRVRIGSRKARTGKRARAALRLTPRRRGRRLITATKAGCRSGRTHVRILRRRR